MRTKYGALAGLFLVIAGVAAPTLGQGAGDKVGLKTVTYAELGKMVRDLKGKVVVVDFWGEY
jgi:hypothetical protein